MARILLVDVDLFFRSRIEGLLPGHEVTANPGGARPDLVVCDLTRTDPSAVAAAWPGVALLGFTNHTDTDGLRRALDAGFDRVIVKSALVERAPAVVSEILAGRAG